MRFFRVAGLGRMAEAGLKEILSTAEGTYGIGACAYRILHIVIKASKIGRTVESSGSDARVQHQGAPVRVQDL